MYTTGLLTSLLDSPFKCYGQSTYNIEELHLGRMKTGLLLLDRDEPWLQFALIKVKQLTVPYQAYVRHWVPSSGTGCIISFGDGAHFPPTAWWGQWALSFMVQRGQRVGRRADIWPELHIASAHSLLSSPLLSLTLKFGPNVALTSLGGLVHESQLDIRIIFSWHLTFLHIYVHTLLKQTLQHELSPALLYKNTTVFWFVCSSGGAQDFLLALSSEITPGEAWGTK